MPRIYLSPSTQDWNPYVDGSGSEEYWMNLLADTLEPYLYANTISFVRNTPEMTAASSIAQANSCLLYTISEPTRQAEISYAVFCLKKKDSHKHLRAPRD